MLVHFNVYQIVFVLTRHNTSDLAHTGICISPPCQRRRLFDPVIGKMSKQQHASTTICWKYFGEVIISMTQSAKFSFKENFAMNRNNVNKVESLSSSLWKCARNSIVSFSQRIGMYSLQGRLIAHQSDYKNGHDCSCPMSFPQSAYLFFYFARRSAKAG